jgi:hypothetical protein
MTQHGTTDIFGRQIRPRNIAEFEADFDDDGIDVGDRFFQWPGRGVAEAVGQMFRDMGFRVTGARDEEEHGWTFDVIVGRQRFWFQVTDLGDSVILISEDMGGPPGSTGISYANLLSELDARFSADARFRNVRWFTPEEYEARPIERRPIDLTYDPARPLPEIKVENFHAGLLRTLLFVLLRFFGLPFGVIEVMLALGALQDHEPSAMNHAWFGAVLILAGTFGAGWLVRKQNW